MTVRTSQSHPIYVSWLRRDLPGRLGLSFAPGKKSVSKFGGTWRRDLAVDLDRLVGEYGVDLLVCLLEDHELQRLGIPAYVDAVKARGIELLRLPIRDGGVLPELDPVLGVVQRIVAGVRAGQTVVVHCAGGLGRAGTVGGCALVELGATAEEALDILKAKRSPNCPETVEQCRFIRRYAHHAEDPAWS